MRAGPTGDAASRHSSGGCDSRSESSPRDWGGTRGSTWVAPTPATSPGCRTRHQLVETSRPKVEPSREPPKRGPTTRRGHRLPLPLAVASRTDAGGVTRHPAHAGVGTKPALTPHSSGNRPRVLPGRSPFVVGTRPYEWPPARAGAWGPASAAPAPPPPRSPWPPEQGRAQGRALRPRGAAPRLQPLARERSPLGLWCEPIGRRGPAE